MTCFSLDGHITDEALRALAADNIPDEENRLELAEHLSFCNACLEKYAALLTDDALLTPPQPLAEKVRIRIRRKARQIFFNGFTRAAAAVVLAMLLWVSGVFSPKFIPHPQPDAPQPPPDYAAQMQAFCNTAMDGLTAVFAPPAADADTEKQP